MKVVLSARGQIAVPKALRDRLGLQPGQVLDWSVDRGRLVAVKSVDVEGVDAVYGTLRVEGTDEALLRLRGPVDAVSPARAPHP